MEIINFENYLSGLMSEKSIRSDVETICSLARRRETVKLSVALKGFHDSLLLYYFKTNALSESAAIQRLANTSFSQFLQYFFHYLLRSNSDITYVNERLIGIITNNPDNFYYSETIANKNEVTLWIDPTSGETALTGVCRKADANVLELLLNRLKIAFKLSQSTLPIPKELEHYLFYENQLGYSALSLVWSKNKADLETRLLDMATVCYGNKETLGFRGFMFQVDAEGNSLLMRATKRGHKNLILAIFDGISRSYGSTEREMLQYLLAHQNKKGETVLHEAINVDRFDLLDLFLKRGASTFGIESQGFKRFLLLADEKGTNLLLLASEKGNRKIIYLIFSLAKKNAPMTLKTIKQLVNYQDHEGYTALMKAAEAGHIDSVRYLLNLLLNLHYYPSDSYESESILRTLQLRTTTGESAIQLAVKRSRWDIVEYLIDCGAVIEKERTLIELINYARDNEDNVLTRLYHEEEAFRMQLSSERREPTQVESWNSLRRLKLAKRLFRAGLRSSALGNMPTWSFISAPSERLLNFFSIFCGSSRQRTKRTVNQHCIFLNKEYQTSIPEEAAQIREEALINIIAILKESNLDSIEQVSFIRNGNRISDREKTQLIQYNQAVDSYYQENSVSLLEKLKAVSTSSLEAAFALDYPYILVDSGENLLLLNKDTIFCASLLNSVKQLHLNSDITPANLKSWLDLYFAPQYTLHPFDPKLLDSYPAILNSLGSIASDISLLNRNYESLRGTTLKSLFLLDNQPIDLSELAEVDFFTRHASQLNFRAENFHQLFFSLPTSEKIALKQLLGRYTILAARYDRLSPQENEYLNVYGAKLIDLIRKSPDINAITPLEIIDFTILTHEEILSKENYLSGSEKKQLIASFHALKNSLISNGRALIHGKAALQLLVFLLPNAIRSIATENQTELAIPIGLITSDVALRELLTRLVSHPQTIQIFSGQLATKVLGLVGETANRVPIVGSALAVYGLIQSGKALITADSNDPNRSYYAHLLFNNVATIGVMGAEAIAGLSFLPAFALFAALTADQILTEGRRIHDNVLHLSDDKNHPLSRWYTELKLGLSIVPATIEIVQEQRQLFHRFLSYLVKIEPEKDPDAIVAVTLPAVHRIQLKNPLQANQESACQPLHLAPNQTQVHSQSDLCITTSLVTDKKEDYSFELGVMRKVCERRDPFYDELALNNYTLLGRISIFRLYLRRRSRRRSYSTSARAACRRLIG